MVDGRINLQIYFKSVKKKLSVMFSSSALEFYSDREAYWK